MVESEWREEVNRVTGEVEALKKRQSKIDAEWDSFCADFLSKIEVLKWQLDQEYREQLLNGRR